MICGRGLFFMIDNESIFGIEYPSSCTQPGNLMYVRASLVFFRRGGETGVSPGSKR